MNERLWGVTHNMNKVIYPILLALVLLVPGNALATTDFKVFVSSTTTHELGLKATQMDNGQIIPISGFAISPESVVQVKQGEDLTVFTSTNEPQRIEKVKVTDSNGKVTELKLVPLLASQYSLGNLQTGVYVLNVISDNQDSTSLNAYETILIILQPNQGPVENTEITKIIQRVKIWIAIGPPFEDKPSPCYFDPNLEECKPENGKCKPGFGFNDDDQCIPIGKCPSGYGRLDDDETGKCYPKNQIKKCPDGSIIHKGEVCTPEEPRICLPSFGPPPMCSEPPQLICDENTPPGVTCIDEGDPDDCEDGFEDRGSGCIPVEEEEDTSSEDEETGNEDQEEDPEANLDGGESSEEDSGSEEGDSEQPEPQFG